ncbi:MAG: ribose 5-phosphate isomerase B [Clostridia bacterium]|nr:ribose 5-phosphate isomerase B [Clostridia bacterium]
MIALACDHGGYELKCLIKEHLLKKGFNIKDFGCDSEESVDYPDFAYAAAKAVVSGECEKGILICGTGIGMSIAANKVKGIRCALCSDTYSAHATREHNDSNMLALGARVTGCELAKDIVDAWLSASFIGAQHVRRLEKIRKIESEQ